MSAARTGLPIMAAGRSPTAASAPVRILGIDPGSRITGWGMIEMRGTRTAYLAHGRVLCGNGALAERLLRILRELEAVVAEHRPDEAAAEQVFVKLNVGSALVLGQARGAAICAVAAAGLPLAEYAPAQIKSAVVGSGRAEKTQVQHMVQRLLNLAELPPVDAADALAVALCHAHWRAQPQVLQATPRRRATRRWLSL